MFDPGTLILAIGLYMAALFGIANYVEKKRSQGQDPVDNPWIYSLSQGVYCTTWAFYGAVGYAARFGFLYLSFLLGVTLCTGVWWTVLRRLVRIKNAHRITSIADFVSARYGKSQGLGSLATLVMLIGIIPYLSLQFKAVLATATMLLPPGGIGEKTLGLATVTLMILFTILFGLRRQDSTERHPGMIMALSVESVIKLVAILTTGIYVTYVLFHGFGDIFGKFQAAPLAKLSHLGKTDTPDFLRWVGHLLLGIASPLLLPRQFHVAVVENARENHIKHALWFLPLYLFLFCIFILPIALGGLLLGLPAESADTFTLGLPLLSGLKWLALPIFLGGFSAGTGMIMIETMTIATMVSNQIVLPILDHVPYLRPLRRQLLKLRWVLAALIILAGYGYEETLGKSTALVGLGILSFVAAVQFIPVVIGGLYWRYGNKVGAALSLTSGFLAWSYSLIVPILAKSGWIPGGILTEGPFGIALLKPDAFLGLSGLDPLTHGIFWTLACSTGFYFFGSLLFPSTEEERNHAEQFVDILQAPTSRAETGLSASIAKEIDPAPILRRIHAALLQYFTQAESETKLGLCTRNTGLQPGQKLSVVDLAELRSELERTLAGAIGTSSAHSCVRMIDLMTPAQEQELSRYYAALLAGMRVPPSELRRKIHYYRDRESLLSRQLRELNREIAERKRVEEALRAAQADTEQALHLRDEFISIASHELKTPLTPLLLLAQDLKRKLAHRNLQSLSQENLEKVLAQFESQLIRLSRLIDNLLDVSKIRSGRMTLALEKVNLSELVNEVVERFRAHPAPAQPILVTEVESGIHGNFDAIRIEQVVTNLMTNAIKFSAQKPVFLTLKKTADRAVLTVRDQGIGIPSGQWEKIFGLYQQAIRSIHYGGLGLGLYIARQITEAHQGSIRVASGHGAGSVFTVELPLK